MWYTNAHSALPHESAEQTESIELPIDELEQRDFSTENSNDSVDAIDYSRYLKKVWVVSTWCAARLFVLSCRLYFGKNSTR
jgi:hypothetical protein